MKLARLGITIVTIAMALTIVPELRAQQTKKDAPAAAPIPAQIATATSVFISNAGVDANSMPAFRRAGDPYQPYNLLYTAVKAWGRYQLLDSPAHADLIFEVRFTAPLSDCGKATAYAPQLELTILDAKSHFVLWTISEAVEGAFLRGTWQRNLNEGVTNVVGDMQRLVAQPVTAAALGG